MTEKNTFYILRSPDTDITNYVYGDPVWESEFKYAKWTKKTTTKKINCKLHPGHKRSGGRTGKLSIEVQSDKIGDFIWTWHSECLVTEKVLALLKRNEITGYSVVPASIEYVQNGQTAPPEVWELVVSGKAGEAHPDSGINKIYHCPECNLVVYSSFRNGIIVDEKKWDRSDFSTVEGYPKYILITERVKKIIIKNKLTNCQILKSADLDWGPVVRPEDVYGKNKK